MLVNQRPDIVIPMLVKNNFHKISCSLFYNDWCPRLFDTIDCYETIKKIKLNQSKFKYKTKSEGWTVKYPDIHFKGNFPPVYGYVVIYDKNTLLWSERFPTAPFCPLVKNGYLEVDLKLKFELTNKVTYSEA